MLPNSITYLTNVSYGLATSVGLFLAQGADGAGADPVPGAGVADGAGQDPNAFQQIFFHPLVLPLGFFLLFYLFFMAPEKKRRAEEAKLMDSLKKNDRVITIGGIHGTVVSVGEGVVTLKIDEAGSTRVKFNRTAIATRVDDKKEKKAPGSKD